ncbi:MAG: hypothetical protein ACT6FG_04110 [Methanosarcinaceae archaeon]
MRKELVIPVVVIIMVAAVSMYWYYGDRDDVRIADLDAPHRLGLHTANRLSVTLLNNESVPVNVNIDVKNAFVGENGTSLPTSRTMIFKDPDSMNDLNYYQSGISLAEEVTLMPGENTIGIFLGYLVADNYSVEVRIYQNERFIDEGTVIIEVPLPELLLQLEYEKATTDYFDYYRVDGYLINKELSGARHVPTKVTVTNNKTGEIVSTDMYNARVGSYESALITHWNISHWNISNWKDSPMTLIELAHNESSNMTYMPLTSVVKGKIGDQYRVNVTSTWHDQVISAEMVIPPA